MAAYFLVDTIQKCYPASLLQRKTKFLLAIKPAPKIKYFLDSGSWTMKRDFEKLTTDYCEVSLSNKLVVDI